MQHTIENTIKHMFSTKKCSKTYVLDINLTVLDTIVMPNEILTSKLIFCQRP